MSKSTPNPTLSPEGARVLLAEYLPARLVPESARAILQRSESGTAPPCHRVPWRGRVKRMYDPAEVREWALGQLPDGVRLAMRYLALAESAASLGLITSPDPPLGEYSARASIIGEEGLSEYVGDLEGAEDWLRERAGKRGPS